MRKKYNTPHRSRVVKTRLSEDEYADFTARLAPYGISQSEFLRQAIRRTTIRPVIHVSAVNDELLSAVGKGKGRGYERWATMHNLKQMAATLNVYQEYGFTSPEQLEAAVDTAYQEMRQTSGELKALETKLQGKKELQQQVLAYAKTKPARDGLKAQKSEKARAAYRQANESDFIIVDAAARYFREHGITKLPARKALQDEIEQLVSKKSSLYNTYHEQKQRYTELQTVKRNIDQILRRSEPHRRKEQSHER